MKKLIWLGAVGIALFAVTTVTRAADFGFENIFENSVSVDLKVNGSDGPVKVEKGERIVVSWISDGATRCRGNWSKNDIKTSGTIAGKISRSVVVKVACINSDGDRDDDSVVVNVSGGAVIPNPTNTQQPTINLTLSAAGVTSVAGSPVIDFVVKFDGTRVDPTSIALELTCPTGVSAEIPGEDVPRCNKSTRMRRAGDGQYVLTLRFHNTSSQPQLVGAFAKAYGSPDIVIATDKDAFTIQPAPTTSAQPTPRYVAEQLYTNELKAGLNTLYRFKVIAPTSSEVILPLSDLYFVISKSGFSVSDIALRVYTDNEYSSLFTNGIGTDGTFGTTGDFESTLTNSRGRLVAMRGDSINIPAGATRYFELTGLVRTIPAGETSSISTALWPKADQSLSLLTRSLVAAPITSAQPTITVVTPATGETWSKGEQKLIQWSAPNYTGQIGIALQDSSSGWTLVNSVGNIGYAQVILPQSFIPGTYYIRVAALDERGNMTTSGVSKNFTITASTTTTTASPITVNLKANGFDGPLTVSAGTSVGLSYTTTGKIAECKGDVSGYDTGFVSVTANATKTYSVTCSQDGGTGSASDSVTVNVTPTTITTTPAASTAPTITVTGPLNSYGTPAFATITFTSSGVSTVKIEACVNKTDCTVLTASTPVTANMSSYGWAWNISGTEPFVGPTGTKPVYLKVTDLASGVYDFTDSYIYIVPPGTGASAGSNLAGASVPGDDVWSFLKAFFGR